jgi:hypothetical protein
VSLRAGSLCFLMRVVMLSPRGDISMNIIDVVVVRVFNIFYVTVFSYRATSIPALRRCVATFATDAVRLFGTLDESMRICKSSLLVG